MQLLPSHKSDEPVAYRSLPEQSHQSLSCLSPLFQLLFQQIIISPLFQHTLFPRGRRASVCVSATSSFICPLKRALCQPWSAVLSSSLSSRTDPLHLCPKKSCLPQSRQILTQPRASAVLREKNDKSYTTLKSQEFLQVQSYLKFSLALQ